MAPGISRTIEGGSSVFFEITRNDDEGNKVYIEVKTKTNGGPNNIDFYLTENELQRLREPNHLIYYVCGIKRKKKTIYVIREEILKEIELKPILYRIRAKAMGTDL